MRLPSPLISVRISLQKSAKCLVICSITHFKFLMLLNKFLLLLILFQECFLFSQRNTKKDQLLITLKSLSKKFTVANNHLRHKHLYQAFECSLFFLKSGNKMRLLPIWLIFRGGSRAAATSKMECFVMIVNGWKPLTIITKHSILDVAAALDPPLILILLETHDVIYETQTIT